MMIDKRQRLLMSIVHEQNEETAPVPNKELWHA